MRSPRILTMLMFLLLSCQGDYDMAAPWHLEQISTEERRHGIIRSGSRWLFCTEANSNPHPQSKTRRRRAASMSNASYHFSSTVIFAVVERRIFQVLWLTGWTFQPASRAAHGLLPRLAQPLDRSLAY